MTWKVNMLPENPHLRASPLLHHSDTSLILTEFNMALMKAATQSETLWNYDPSLAVDGDTNTCSFTPQSDVQRWWQVSSNANRVSTI